MKLNRTRSLSLSEIGSPIRGTVLSECLYRRRSMVLLVGVLPKISTVSLPFCIDTPQRQRAGPSTFSHSDNPGLSIPIASSSVRRFSPIHF